MIAAAARRDPPLAPAAPATRACPPPAASSATRRRALGRRADRRAGPEGHCASVARRSATSTPTSSSTTRRARRATCARWASRSRRSSSETGRRARTSRSSLPATGRAGSRRAESGCRLRSCWAGPSAEHDVSLVSGRAIADALAERGHDVTGWLIDLAGRWWRLPPAALDMAHRATDFDDPAGLGADGPSAAADALSSDRRRRPGADRVHRAARAFWRGRDGPGAVRGGRTDLYRRRRGGIGGGHGQGAFSSASRPHWVCRSCRGSRLRATDWHADPRAVQRRIADFSGLPGRPPRHRQAGPPWFIGRYFDRSPPRRRGVRRRRDRRGARATTTPSSSRPTSTTRASWR